MDWRPSCEMESHATSPPLTCRRLRLPIPLDPFPSSFTIRLRGPAREGVPRRIPFEVYPAKLPAPIRGYFVAYAYEGSKPRRLLAAKNPAIRDGEWRVQNGCLHPGYPECPRPVERESLETRGEAVSVGWRSPRPAELSRAGLTLFRVIVVARGAERKPRSGMWSPWRKLQIRRTRLLLG